MIRRKFSFNLAPVKTAAKTEPVAQPEPEPSPSQASPELHRRHMSKDGICDSSPFISRRALDAHTDQELRLACRLILHNFKPSDHGMENTDPKLDFGAMQRRKESRSQPADVGVRMPTDASADLATATVGRKPSKTRTRAKADLEIRARTGGDVPVRANSSRKRAGFAWLDERDDKREEKLKMYGRSPSIDKPRSASLPADTEDHVTMPVTVISTLAHSKVASTAPTSASLPSGRSSKRRSRQLENPAAVADAQAAEWMRSELEKTNLHDASQPQARPSTAARSLNRTASIKENIKGYVFPGTRSRALSRAQSKESLRAMDTNDEQDLQRSGSGAGWRNWGMPRRSGSRSNSRPGTSKGHPDEPDQPRKSESNMVNLNRELPPLPGLDQWKEPEQPKESKPTSPKSPTAGTHIASMMRPQDHQEPSPAARRQHRKSGSDTLAMQYTQAFPPRQSSRNQSAPISPQFMGVGPDSHNQMMNEWSSSSNLDQRLELDSRSTNHTRQRSGDNIPTTSGTTSAEAANFPRNMSLDTPSRSVSNEAKPTKRDEQKSRLKNIFSGWMTKKDKKVDWMHKLEKEGVKEGVLVQEGTTASPVVRY